MESNNLFQNAESNSMVFHPSYEELLKEFHPTKNGDLTPFDVTAGSGIEIWWKCDVADDVRRHTETPA